jgi:hypothetical protein
MRKQKQKNLIKTLIAFILLAVPFATYAANTGNSSGYAWGETTGYISFSGEGSSTDYGVIVTDSDLTGYAWGETTGWVSMNCSNTDSCGTIEYKVTNDGDGNLSGYAWGENIGWISFKDETASNYAVTIDDDGNFSGYAWSENGGFINMNDSGSNYGVTTSWNPKLPRMTTHATTNIADITATGNAEITNIGIDAPERFIEWGVTSGVYTHSCTAGTGNAGLYSCTMTGLTAETTYYVRAKAINTEGENYGEEVSFITLPLQDITITNPDSAIITDTVDDGYITIDNGSITDTAQATTVVNVTVQDDIFQMELPQDTQITGDGSFNFQQFTAQNVTQSVQGDQPTSRAALEIGIPNEQLSFSNNITLQVHVGTAFNGQTLDILYQNDGDPTWYTHATPTCTITNGYCTFQTNHATIYTINGIHQVTGDTPMNISVAVQDTLSMDCFDTSDSNTTVTLGTTTAPGTVTAGTPAIGQSQCTVTTNDDQGYYLTIQDNNAITHTTLTHTDPNTGTIYEIPDLTQYNETTPVTENWSAPTTKGLGFSITQFPQADTSHNTLGTIWSNTNQCPEGTNPDTNDYAGIPDTPQAISAVTAYQATETTTQICYKVDVPPSQPSGQYTGEVTFTATSDASGYYQ